MDLIGISNTVIVGDERIMAGVNSGEDGYLHLHFVDFSPEPHPSTGAREAYAWRVMDADCVVVGESGVSDRLMGGVGVHVTPVQMLDTFLSFLFAAAENYSPDPDDQPDGPVFSLAVDEWAYQNKDALEMIKIEITEDFGS